MDPVLILSGAVSFTGAVGSGSSLASFSLDSGSIESWPSSITTQGEISFTPSVAINEGLTCTLTGGAITFASSVDGPGGLILNGPSSFNAPVGAVALANFSLASGSITTWPSSISAKVLSFTPNVSIPESIPQGSSSNMYTLTGTTSITFNGTVEGPGNLTLNGGDIIFAGNVGDSSSLSSLLVATGNVFTWPSIMEAGTMSFPSGITVTGDPILTSTTSTTFTGTLDGTGSLTLNGNSGIITFNGAVGSNFALENLQINSASSVAFASTLSGASSVVIQGVSDTISFDSAVGASAPLSSLLATSTNGPITFARSLDVSGSVIINGNSGTVAFNGAVGEITSATSFQVNSLRAPILQEIFQQALFR